MANPVDPINVYHQDPESAYTDEYYNWRVPFVFNHDTNSLAIGQPGEYHMGIRKLVPGYNQSDGMIGLAHGSPRYVPGMAWLDTYENMDPAIHKLVQAELVKHYPEAAQNFNPKDDDEDWEDNEPSKPSPEPPQFNRTRGFGMQLGSWRLAFAEATGDPRLGQSPTVEDYPEAGPPANYFHSEDYPFVYNGLTHNVIIGGLGAFHDDVTNHLDRQNDLEKMAEWNQANLGRGGLHGNGRVQPNGLVKWYYKPDLVNNDVVEALGKHLGVHAQALGEWTPTDW